MAHSRSRPSSLLGTLFVCIASFVACSSPSSKATTDAGTTATTPPVGCRTGDDCPSHLCNQATSACEGATCGDGVQNGDETALDCGGSCAPCADGKACGAGADCASGVCTASECKTPTPTDGVKNGGETDVDCGGPSAPACDVGKGCAARTDCTTHVCSGGICLAPTPADGEKNGTETDVDCGGPSAPPCADGKTCAAADDCTSLVCNGAVCQVPTPTDQVKNGTETDVDCGGAGNPTCAIGKGCAIDADCTSAGCNYAKKCAVGRSCTRHFGGDTCGLGGAGGDGAASWEDCCLTQTVTPSSGPTSGQAIKLGKYQVTAGRMRAFLESVSYDVRGFVQSARAAGKIPAIPGDAQNRSVLEAAWDAYLPTSFDGNTNANELADCTQGQVSNGVCNPGTLQPGLYTSIRNHLGGLIFKNNAQSQTGCFVGAPGTHAFRFPDDKQDGDPPEQGQDVYDTKSMQCIDYLVGQAFCVWDGGRLELLPEWQAATGPGAYPWSPSAQDTGPTPVQPGSATYWGCRFPWATDANQSTCGTTWNPPTQSIEYASYKYSYEYPKLTSTDFIVFISAPGRTRGRGPGGHSDILGNVYELTSTVAFTAAYATSPTPFNATHRWSGNGSWEVHTYSKSGGSTTMLLNKYGKLGLRCAYP